jgi:hypothetical protein
VLVLPITAFGAGIGHSNAGDLGDPSALVHHTFAGTWKADHPMGGDVAEVIEEDNGLKAKKKQEKLKQKYKVKRRWEAPRWMSRLNNLFGLKFSWLYIFHFVYSRRIGNMLYLIPNREPDVTKG